MSAMPTQDDYKVRLDVFEGPLDLLLYLIKKDEIDVYNIPIELITRQYMEYLSLMRLLDLNIAGEFLVMAATLMMIKSRMLLPVEERPPLEEEEEDPRWELVRQLVEYKKFKEAAHSLHTMEVDQENVFRRGAEPLIAQEDEPGVTLEDVSIFDLISAFNETLKKVKLDDVGEVFAERFTVVDKIEFILDRIKREKKVDFSSLFSNMATRHEIVCTFLALLELIRLRQVRAEQDETFAKILVVAAQEI